MTRAKLMGAMVAVLLCAVFGWSVYRAVSARRAGGERRRTGPEPAPVEVADVVRGPIVDRRTFSGSLESPAEFVVSPKVGGRIEEVTVELADPVKRGQVVARLDDDEHRQAVAQSEAELAVTAANLAEATSGLEIAARELERMNTLFKRGVASEANLDTSRAEHLAKQAAVQVARAHVTRAEAALEAAKIRLGYTTVTAGWPNGDEQRVVAARFVDEGDTVAANTPLLSIVELNPINAVLHITEKDYAYMTPGQEVTLTTDAYPGETFAGKLVRIAPSFQQSSRQARVELTVDNRDLRLRPGMFVRAAVAMRRLDDAVIVPETALTGRGDRPGVFVVSDDGHTVAWREVTAGIREGDRVQVVGDGVSGRVVTLGQHMLDDGAPIAIPAPRDRAPRAEPPAVKP